MEIHQLEYFLAIEKYQSFSGASLEICVSQSTLSQQIRKLEKELGVQLFIRYPRSVCLTPAGEEFLEHAQKIISEIQLSRETVQKYTNFEKGLIKIGVIPSMAYLILNQVITNFIKSYPDFDFKIHTADTDDLLEGLRNKKVNVAFINTPFTDEYKIDFYLLMDDNIVVLVATKHPLANESLIDLSDLSKEKFLMIKSSSWFQNTLIHACNEAGFEPNIILDYGTIEMVRGFVEEGIGVALMGHHIAQSILNSNTLIVPIKQTLKRQIGLAVPRYTRIPLGTSFFRDFTLKEVRKFIYKGADPKA
jgi:DNA-binding transcriptional LysR family regulator